MGIQKKHKIYAGLVGAALIAWGIDAAFFGAPAAPGPADGAAAAASVPAPSVVAAPMPAPPTHASDSKWLSERLRMWSAQNPMDPAEVRDVFAPSAAWVAPIRPVAAPATLPVGNLAGDFTRMHHLTAVVLSPGSGGNAVIDGRLLRVGQTVGGCRLVAVSSGSAELMTPAGERFRVVIGADEPQNVK